ncbi:hypothetical protein IE4872_PD02131 (plasmid) [Rhizobium gallicum]|uniref:Uncharacterized protein n=1 Tax=Rhizobium gallicum TaxID=56730 RepID=A0A1L5NXJ8_9HYPH|nr:hypothetical protein IE4872_PD02131 [Rhizobium gallicum]
MVAGNRSAGMMRRGEASAENDNDWGNVGNSGSRWLRWEPHIPAPGTVLNDQFNGADSWEDGIVKLTDCRSGIAIKPHDQVCP